MLHPVWPSVYFWYFLGLCSSLLWLIPSMAMEFIKKSTPRVGVFVRLTILISWFVGNTLLSIIFLSLIQNPRTDHFFRGYERVGRTVGYVLLLFGNIGLYYYSEKSIACMLTFLFLGFFCLCTLFYIQPLTDFGVLDFFLSASVTQALSLFGLHIYSWLVFIAVIVIANLRYQLELVLLQQPPREVRTGRMANSDSEGEARDKMERAKDMIQVLQPRREVDSERNRSNVPYLRIPKKSGRDLELATNVIDRDSELERDVIDLDLERIVSNIIVPSFQNLWYLNLSGVKQKLNDNTRQQISKLPNLKHLVVPGEKLNPNIISDSTISESQALKLLQQPPREVESEGESESVGR